MEPDILERIVDGQEQPTNLPFALLKSITEHFSEDRVIGQGGFAKVYKGVLRNGDVAVKRIRNNHSIDDNLFYREVDSLLTISHQNIVRFLGFCANTDHTAIKLEGSRQHIYAEVRERLLCFEYISNGSLQKYITDELRGLEWNKRYQIIRGICEGLHHLHKEKHVYHMDLKPANILLDNHMEPKITDFGLSRLDEKSQTMSDDRFGSLGYCAPEYLHSGKMSYKSDIFSLGIIITELVSGDKGIPDNSKTNVLRRWRHRWRKSGKETPWAYQQVAKCMEIGLLCQEIDPAKRPFIWDLIHDIREVDSANGTIRNACEYTFGQISPYSEDDLLGVEPLELHFSFELNKKISCSLKLTNQTDTYIAFNIQNMSPLPYCTQPNKGIVPPRSKRSVDVTLHLQDTAPRDMERADEFIVWSTKVNDGLEDKDITINMFSTESAVVDAMNLDVVFDAEESTKVSKELILRTIIEDLVISSAGRRNDQEAAKAATETLQASNKTSECTDKMLVQITIASKDLAPHSVTGEMFMDKTDDKVAEDETKFDESFSPKQTLLDSSTSYQNYQEGESSTSNQNYQEGAQAFSEPQSARDTTTETEVMPGSSMVLDVHPLELCFHFEPNKLIACSVDLSNNTDEILAFELVKKNDEETSFLSRLPMFGVVDPRTTYTLVLIMDKHKILPRARNVDFILKTSAYSKSLGDKDKMFIQHFQNVEQLGITVHQVTLKGVCALQRGTIFESIPPSIKIISMEDNDAVEGHLINSVDANQMEPLIITGFYNGHVQIWNCDTEKYMDSCKLQERCVVWSVRFIARKGWFVVGSDDGFIRVYNYKKKMQKTTSFKAHNNVYSLAIHPTEPYVLSASNTTIKLWDWNQGWFGWKCIQTFKEHSMVIRGVAFNPVDHNSFASASYDRTIKIWSLDSPHSKYTLSGHSDCLFSLAFFTRDGHQYLISVSQDKTAKIWDRKECVHTLSHQSGVVSILPHPKLPLLVTGTEDGTVYLWSSTDFRLNRILNIGGLSDVDGLSCFLESGRVVVAHAKALSVIEINDEEEQGGSSSNNENSISAAD